jgi:hypothetical protein
MADRQIEVNVDDRVGKKGNRFLTATVTENERVVGGVAVPIGSSPEQIAYAIRKNALTTTSPESRDLLNQAADLVPGLKKDI